MPLDCGMDSGSLHAVIEGIITVLLRWGWGSAKPSAHRRHPDTRGREHSTKGYAVYVLSAARVAFISVTRFVSVEIARRDCTRSYRD